MPILWIDLKSVSKYRSWDSTHSYVFPGAPCHDFCGVATGEAEEETVVVMAMGINEEEEEVVVAGDQEVVAEK